MRVRWSPHADIQVDEAVEYIARDNPTAALDWLDEVLDRVAGIASFPDSGRMVPETQREDIRPLSEFRAGVASFVRQVNETGRPLVLTQRGRGVAVVLDIREFEAMRERLALLEDITRAEAQLAAGEGIPHDEAKARILKRIDACR